MSDFQNNLVYSVTKVQIASLDIATEAYGSPVTMSWVQGIETDPQIDDDLLKNRGAMERGLSVLTHYEGTLKGAGVQAAVLNILDSTSNSLSGTTPNQVRRLEIAGGTNAPYFGMLVFMPIDTSGTLVLGFPMCQVSSRLMVSSEQNQFSIPEIPFRGLRWRMADDSVLSIARPWIYETEPTVTDFDAQFGI